MRRRPSFRPQLAVLEDRRTPSSVTDPTLPAPTTVPGEGVTAPVTAATPDRTGDRGFYIDGTGVLRHGVVLLHSSLPGGSAGDPRTESGVHSFYADASGDLQHGVVLLFSSLPGGGSDRG